MNSQRIRINNKKRMTILVGGLFVLFFFVVLVSFWFVNYLSLSGVGHFFADNIIYSLFKGVNGIQFSDLFKFIDYEHNSEDINPTEVFYDKSVFIKFDFLLNN